MRPLNVVIKGFTVQGAGAIVERAFRDVPLGYCISISDSAEEIPQLKAQDHVTLLAHPLRMIDMQTGYDVDWNTVRPLDEKLIYDMRECEAVVLDMFTRYERYTDISYAQRKRAYLQHLRYWNHVIEEHDIDLYLCGHIPHNCFDYVIYSLCKRKGIPTMLFYYGIIPDALMFKTDWELSAVEVKERYQALKQGGVKDVELSPPFQAYVDQQTSKNADAHPWYMDKIEGHAAHRQWSRKLGTAFRLLHKPHKLLSYIFSPSMWGRRKSGNEAFLFYERQASLPDLTKKYIYVALHAQPECSSSPMAGAFVDQLLIVQLLAACLPDDVQLYVKEHPHQGNRARSVEFYQDLLDVRGVTLVSRQADTFQLIEHSLAVATGTGTVGFESLFRGKPVFLFGHRFFQYAPGVFSINTAEDCHNAVAAIIDRGEKPTLQDLRIFMKAYEEVAIPGYAAGIYGSVSHLTPEQNVMSIGSFLAGKISALQ